MIRLRHCYLPMLVTLLISCPSRCAQDVTSATTAGDILIPQKGHPFIGNLSAATNQQVTFVTDAGPTVSLKWPDVKELDINHKTTITGTKPLSSPSGPTSVALESARIEFGPDGFLITSPDRRLNLPQADLVSVSYSTAENETKNPSTLWNGSATGKGSLTAGTQSQQTLGAQIYLRRTHDAAVADWHHQVSTLILEANNSLTSQVGTPSIRLDTYDGSFKHQIYFWRDLYADVMAEGYHNSSLNLYLQQSYGGGIGKNLYKDKRNTLEASADFLHISEHFSTSVPSVEFTGVRLREDYSYALFYIKDTPLTLAENISYTPALDLKNAWQIRGVVTLNIPITKAFSTTLSFFDDYLENAPNARKNYSTTSVGLTYTIPAPK